jgi:predicted metalloendopeptidase
MPTSAVNAYYSPEENSISILAGIIAPPFYHKDYTMQSLLATIGSIIGHELSHAFDSSGVMFDPLGSYVIPEKGEDSGWMSASDIEAYEEREQCFVHRYNVTSRMGNKIDSVKTLGENIADTMGLRASFDAFVKLQGGRDIEPEVMREFIESYSQMWCTNASPDVELMQTMLDPHSPGGTRINGAISSLYFSSASGGKDPLRTAYGCSDKDKRSSKKNGPCALW